MSSGDLALKKTYPALFTLFKNNHLPKNVYIIGYARSTYELNDFRNRVTSKFAKDPEAESFAKRCFYASGKYDESASYEYLAKIVHQTEEPGQKSHRIFYLALPPSVFIPASHNLKQHVYSTTGYNRLVVEKPFGKDLESSRELTLSLAKCWKEEEVHLLSFILIL
jgi:glucose-6-phosphate 1-dehydrogenase